MGICLCSCLKTNAGQEEGTEETPNVLVCKVGPTGTQIRVHDDRVFHEISGSGTLLGSFPLDCDSGVL